MKENQVTFERIRSYILGKMTETESSSFEAELAQDSRLRGEYERLKEIASAADSISHEESIRSVLKQAEEDLSFQNRVVDEKKLKEDLLIAERELDKLEGRGFWHHLKDFFTRGYDTLLVWFAPDSTGPSESSTEGWAVAARPILTAPSFTRIAFSLAIAASLALAIILPHNARRLAGFNYAPSQIEFRAYRGDASDLLEKAVSSYNNADYDSALSYLEESRNNLKEAISQLGDSDSDVIVKQGLINELFQVDWYRALTLMKMKKVKDAKHALCDITESDSPYSDDALTILNDVY